MAFTYSKLAEITVGSSNTSHLTFSNIPQTYTDLYVRFSTRATDAFDYGYIAFNDSTSNFSGIRMHADTSSTTVGYQTRSDGYIYPSINSSGTTANTFGLLDLYIPNYRSSNTKTLSAEGFYENNGANGMVIASVAWANSAAITSVSFYPPSAGNRFAQHTTASLYGIRGTEY